MPMPSESGDDFDAAPECGPGRGSVERSQRRSARLLLAVAAALLAVALWPAAASAHDVGQQPETVGDGDCLAVGPPGSGTGTGDRELHKHAQAGTDSGTTLTAADYGLPSCVETNNEFFQSDLWTTILVFCLAGAAILFVVGVLKGAAQMMRGQGTGLGQAIKSILPLLLMSAMLGLIATLPILLIPLMGRVLQIILSAFNALLP